jgi:hypothetical protein
MRKLVFDILEDGIQEFSAKANCIHCSTSQSLEKGRSSAYWVQNDFGELGRVREVLVAKRHSA